MPGGSTPGTAVDMTTFPFTDSAVPTVENQEYWYRYESTERGSISVFAGRSDTTIEPLVSVFLEDLTPVRSFVNARVVTVPLAAAGEVYLFQVLSAITAGTATMYWEARVLLGLPVDLTGYIFIPTDFATGGATIIDPATGLIVGLFGGFPPGERGATIGGAIDRLIVPDKTDQSIVWIYSTLDLTVLLGPLSGALVAGATGQSDPPMAASAETFYVGQRRSDLSAYLITAVDPLTGAIGTTWTPPLVSDTRLYAMAVTEDNATLYYVVSLPSQPVRAWDLDGDVALANLAAGVTDDTPLDVIVLDDGSVVVSRMDDDGLYYVVRYSAAGATLNTYLPLSLPGYSDFFIDHIDRAADPDNFWVWLQGPDLSHAFVQYQASDGTVVSNVTTYFFTNGITGATVIAAGAMPTVWFGSPSSCPLIIIPPGGDVPINTILAAVGSYLIGGDGGGGGGAGVPPPATLIYSAAPPDFGLQTVPMRRLRRAPHLADEQRWLTYDRFQLDLQTGVGLVSGQGSDPQIMLRWSNDGGHTWSHEHWVSAGRMGATKTRAIWRQLGRARTRTFEVVVSDPVAYFLAAAYIQVSPGDGT